MNRRNNATNYSDLYLAEDEWGSPASKRIQKYIEKCKDLENYRKRRTKIRERSKD